MRGRRQQVCATRGKQSEGSDAANTSQALVAYLDRSLKLEKDGLRDENLTSLGAQVADLSLKKLDLLARAASPNLEETVDYRVKVDLMLVCHLLSSPARKMARCYREKISRVRQVYQECTLFFLFCFFPAAVDNGALVTGMMHFSGLV